MKSILDRLYSGEIYPAEQIVPTDPEYRPLGKQIGEECERLKEKLGKDNADRLDKLSDNYYKMSSISSFASFSYGLKLGVLLMCELFTGEDKIGRNND